MTTLQIIGLVYIIGSLVVSLAWPLFAVGLLIGAVTIGVQTQYRRWFKCLPIVLALACVGCGRKPKEPDYVAEVKYFVEVINGDTYLIAKHGDNETRYECKTNIAWQRDMIHYENSQKLAQEQCLTKMAD